MSNINNQMKRSNSFMSPSNRGLHPHVVRDSDNQRDDSYEKEQSIVDVLGGNFNKDYLTSSNLGDAPIAKKQSSFSDFVSNNPLLSLFGAALIGVAVYKSLSGEGGGDFDDDDDRVRIRNPSKTKKSVSSVAAPISSPSPALSPTTVYIQAPSGPVSMPSGWAESSIAGEAKVFDAEIVKPVRRKRRKKPSVVQVRASDGTFTSKTVKVRKKAKK